MTTTTTRLASAVFSLLVCATFAAFFVAQRLKHTPPVVQRFKVAHEQFSPNGDGRFDRLNFNFLLKHTDDVTVDIVDHRGDEVRQLVSDRPLTKYHAIYLKWDGRDDDGNLAPDGVYRARVTLRKEGRSIVVPRRFVLDVTPPRPEVVAIGPGRRLGPELFPNTRGTVTIHVVAPGRQRQLLIFKTSPGPVRLVRTIPLADGQKQQDWDGTTASGRKVSPGTYLVAAQSRDSAGNIGTTPALGRDRLPQLPYGRTLPGRGGVTIRYAAIQAPVAAQAAGQLSTFGIDTRHQPYTWSVRRVGTLGGRGGRGTRPVFHLHAPAASGVYLLQVRTRRHAAVAPFVVQGPTHHRILVVLPTMTWQGVNPADDDGDGAPNVLDHGQTARLLRPYAFGDQLPPGFTENEGPLLTFLDRNHLRYDVTTDVGLAVGRGPKLAGHTGVVLAGDARWLPAGVASRLRAFVRRGGRLASFGTASLRRQVTLTPSARMANPTPEAPTDVFGARIAPIAKGPATLTNERDRLGLFVGDVLGGTGLFPAVQAYEATSAVGDAAELASSAVTTDGSPVIVGVTYGRGIVIRTGVPGFATRLTSDDNSAQLVRRTWQLLSR